MTRINRMGRGKLLAGAWMMIASVMGIANVNEVAATEPEAKPTGPKTRDQIDTRYKWDLSSIFSSDDAWEDAFKRVDALTAEFSILKGSLGKDVDTFRMVIEKRDELFKEYERVMLFAGLSYHEDMSNSQTQGRWDRVQSLGTKVSESTSWFTPELLKIDSKKIDGWLAEDEKLGIYRHAIDDILREREHTLNESEEALLAMAGDVMAAPGNVYGQFTNTELEFPKIKDADGNEVQITPALYYSLIYSPDRRVRRDAFLGMHESYAGKQNTIAALLSSHVKTHVFNAKARKYGSSMEAALSGPNVPVEVYRNLVSTVRKNAHRLHRYVAMRKRIMGLEDIRRYDLYVPMVDAKESKISYDDGVGTILDALKPLGSDYVGTLRSGFESRWIDVYETKNKRAGAYCWGAYTTHPFLLLNYGGTMNDRSTVAHEMGHAMHSWYTTHSQPYVYGDYATFCAEVASTVNEVLLAHYLLNHASTDAERMLLLQQQIEGIRTTVFRQTMFADFELQIHELAESGTPLTAEILRKTYKDLVQTYYGPEMVLDDCADAECLRIPHFYRNFYVFTYATSHCAATNIGRRIIDGEDGAVDGLMNFLSAGSSMYPIDVLKLAGVDMTTPQPIEDTMELFSSLMDQFEALNNKQRVN